MSLNRSVVPCEKVRVSKVRKSKVPLLLRQPILKLVNKSELRLEELVTSIFNHLNVFFVTGELVQIIGSKEDGITIKGNVVKRSLSKNKKQPPDAPASSLPDTVSTFFYDIKILKKTEVITAIPSSALRRPRLPTMSALEDFINANATYEKTSSSHSHWVLNKNINSLKPKKPNSTLKKALMEQKKNAKPVLKQDDAPTLEKSSQDVKKSLKTEKTLLKNDATEPDAKKRKLGKLAKSPKSGVPPVWAKLFKNFPLEPEVVLVRLEDHNGVTGDNFTSMQNATPTVCGKENQGCPRKKMKQITLFDMNKKLASNSASNLNNSVVTMETLKESNVDGATGVLIDVNSGKKSLNKPKKFKKTKRDAVSGKKLQDAVKLVSEEILAAKSSHFSNDDKLKGDVHIASNKPPVDSSFTKISFREFTNKLKLNQEAAVATKPTMQGTLDGILKKGVAKVKPIVKPLPPPTLVQTPPGFENEWFGDAAMVMQFLTSHRNILQPEKSISLSSAMLMEAIVKGSDGFQFLSSILVCLLRTFVQGCSAEDYKEAGVSLLEVPITIYSASELTRLCLREHTDDEDSFVSSKKLELLAKKELHHLETYDKLQIICQLCSHVMTCYTVENYVNGIQNTARKLRAEQLQASMEKNKIKKMLLEKVTPNDNEIELKNEEVQPEKKLNPAIFYGPLALKDSTKTGPNVDEVRCGYSNRRISIQKAKEEKLKAESLKREQALKENEELKKRKDEEDFKKNLTFHIGENSSLRDLKPLGKDRNMSRYWMFSHFNPQLVIEKGWWEGTEANDQANEYVESGFSPRKAVVDAINSKPKNQWFIYENVEELKDLIKCLQNDNEERRLSYTLKKHLITLTAASTKLENDMEYTNGDLDLVEAFREEILDLHSKIMEGALGDMRKSEKWFKDVDCAISCHDFAPSLLTLQNALYSKFLCGAFANADPKKCKVDSSKKGKPHKSNLETWQDMVQACQTMSRLHVLLGLLSACIQWDKSSANTKCKVCKKNSEDTLLLCDSCTSGFHLGCLRPRLRNVPKDDWFCPSCKKAKEKSEREEYSDEDEEKDENDFIDAMKKKVACMKCRGKEDELLMCIKCCKGCHPACHNPPMRNIPRGPWFCHKCRGKKRRSSRGSK